jgi:PleD family two-component response regulator
MRFSAGIQVVEPRGDAEAALQAADGSMYSAKSRRSVRVARQ